jgi:hypothetical protein
MGPDVIWHDDKPFTARDVKFTWDLLTGKSNEKLSVNRRRVVAISGLRVVFWEPRWRKDLRWRRQLRHGSSLGAKARRSSSIVRFTSRNSAACSSSVRSRFMAPI